MTRPALLDVNLLVALFHPSHIHHDTAHSWLAANRNSGWATCPITENGVVRILANPAASGAEYRATDLARQLKRFCQSGNHVFWADDVSLSDDRLFDLTLVAGFRQLTDVYLLGLAKHHDGRLATFDGAIPMAAVRGARPENLVLVRE
jgi:toxin-antitoxin system PIN domain toxin